LRDFYWLILDARFWILDTKNPESRIQNPYLWPMPSILPGYTYDIFISYRHKDNKYEGWVTEFVQNLKKELDATFKDDISIYFDINPEDGLLESHNVDKSLEGKLNCLILIPILSQTYCDPRSFAWQHEFCAFNRLAKADSFGRDIRLRNGNVASRILPVRIRDLDEEDKKLIEDELGSVLRPIDFIYKEQGVNRPLKPEDPEEKNLNKTKYRNQINKTANAIKEIIGALKWKQSGAPELPPAQVVEEPVAVPPEPPRPTRAEKRKRSPLYVAIRAVIITAVVFYFVFWDNKSKKKEEAHDIADKSIAVLPFEDLSPGHDQEYFSDGVAEEILNSLAHVPGLKVAGRTSSFQFKDQKSDLKEVGEKLNVATVLEGSVRKSGNRVRITAQLIGVEDGYHIWSETYERDMTDIFAIQDEVANKIAGVLLKKLAVVSPKTDHTENVKAFEYYLEGKYINLHQFVAEGKPEDFSRAEDLLKKALKLDSNYALAHAGLADLYNTYWNRVSNDPKYMALQQKEIDIAYRLNPDLDYVNNALGQVEQTKGEYEKAYRSFLRAIELNPNDGNNMMALARILMQLGLLDECITVCDHAIRIEPLEADNYVTRGTAFFLLGRADKATNDFKQALRLQPNNYVALTELAYLYLTKNEMEECRKYIDKANIVNPQLKGTGLDAAYEAKLGNRNQALHMKPNFRTYLILGMDKEAVDGILKTFGSTKPPLNVYLATINTFLIDAIEDDPRMKEFINNQKEGYLTNRGKFKLPVLPD
jgi:TolB-like protein/Tfp pilus assembly protein PilF